MIAGKGNQGDLFLETFTSVPICIIVLESMATYVAEKQLENFLWTNCVRSFGYVGSSTPKTKKKLPSIQRGRRIESNQTFSVIFFSSN